MAVANPALWLSSSFCSFPVGKQTRISSRHYDFVGSRMQIKGMLFLKPRGAKPAYMQPFSVHFRVASSAEVPSETSNPLEERIEQLKTKWETVENKSAIAAYGASAFVLVWISSTVIGAISPIPLLPKLMELVGLGYSSWFVYRYLLFKVNRDELSAKISDLKQRIVGNIDDKETS